MDKNDKDGPVYGFTMQELLESYKDVCAELRQVKSVGNWLATNLFKHRKKNKGLQSLVGQMTLVVEAAEWFVECRNTKIFTNTSGEMEATNTTGLAFEALEDALFHYHTGRIQG